MKRLIAFFSLLIATSQVVMAQAPPPTGGSTVGAPIDDHIWFLGMAMIIYGTYSIYQSRHRLATKKA